MFKQKINVQDQIRRIDKKIKAIPTKFEDRLNDLETFADSLYKKTKHYESKLDRFKSFCHNIDILITDKNKDLKLLFANHTVCNVLYNLPNICSNLIENRFEFEVINDFIEKTKKWNSFIECQHFNIDEIVKEEQEEKRFIQIGRIDNKQLILNTQIKPHIINGEFNGVMTISNIMDECCFNKTIKQKIYDKNDYTVFEI